MIRSYVHLPNTSCYSYQSSKLIRYTVDHQCASKVHRKQGCPEAMQSDNGEHFVKGEKQLREEVNNWNQMQIHDFLVQRNIKWMFNPLASSHHDWVWERCI